MVAGSVLLSLVFKVLSKVFHDILLSLTYSKNQTVMKATLV